MKIKLYLLAIAAVGLFTTTPVFAQSYTVTNARIVTVSGSVIERGSIVVRDGLIDAVGANVTAPADTIVIDGSGLTIYPGLIDSASNLGTPAPQGPQQGGPGGFGMGGGAQAQMDGLSNYPVGLRPETQAIDIFKSGDSQFEAARNAGFTTAVVSGRTGIFPGSSLVVNLAGERVSAMTIKSPASQNITFTTIGGGVYPASLLGTFSALRQMFHDAKRQQEVEKLYAADPRSIRRPEADASLTALYPVIERKIPVVFNVSRERDIERALNFAKEFNIKAVISGGQEAWKLAARLKADDVPVLLSLNFPKRTTAAAPEAEPETLSTLRSRVEIPKGAAALVNAGVKVAFQTGGATNLNDVFENAAKTVQSGLSKDAAIRAFTLTPAEIFGVAATTGSIEKGKIANLVAVRGDIYGKDRTVTHVFVDGKLFEQKPKPPAPPTPRGPGGQATGTGTAPAAASALAGRYSITIEVPGDPLPGTLVLTINGTTLTGSLDSVAGSSPIQNGKVTGNAISFQAVVPYGGQSINIDVSGTITDGKISGTIGTDMGAIPFSGTKIP